MNASSRRLMLALCALACSKTRAAPRSPEPQFLRASPIVEHSVPAVLSPREEQGTADLGPSAEIADAPAPSDGSAAELSFRATRTGPETKQGLTSPTAIIAEANALASQSPEAEGFINAVMTYTYVPGAIFNVVTAPQNVTDLVLEPGEEIMGEPAAGDTLRWRLGVGSSAVAGVPQKHIFIKPTRAGLRTNLTLNTDRRTYFLKLESVENEFMVAVQWAYPQSEAAAPTPASPAVREEGPETSRPSDVAALNFDYVVEVVKGRQAWKPQAVFDDGVKTFIRFDRTMLHGESPALFVIARGELQLVNYRVKKNLYVVDRLFKVAELRLGQDEQDVVRIRKASEPPMVSRRLNDNSRPRKPYSPH